MKLPSKRECGKCGSPLGDQRNKGEYALVAKDGGIRGSSRIFVAECEEHGEYFTEPHIGHHSTHLEAQVRRRYPKAIRRLLRAKLNAEQRKIFDGAWEGKRMPSDEEFALWDELSKGD